jgi:ABC-type Zn2+ transport system substrate-binding protein/surface adhesin
MKNTMSFHRIMSLVAVITALFFVGCGHKQDHDGHDHEGHDHEGHDHGHEHEHEEAERVEWRALSKMDGVLHVGLKAMNEGDLELAREKVAEVKAQVPDLAASMPQNIHNPFVVEEALTRLVKLAENLPDLSGADKPTLTTAFGDLDGLIEVIAENAGMAHNH